MALSYPDCQFLKAPPGLPKGEENGDGPKNFKEIDSTQVESKDLWWLQQVGPPLPIPNREVKPLSADGTWAQPLGE